MIKDKIKCIVIAGEEYTGIAKVLKEFSHIQTEQFSMAKKFTDHITKHSYEILIANADLLGGNLFFLQQIKNRPAIIIISSNKNLAQDGYEYNISGFLSLPLNEEKLFNALQKAQEEVARKKTERLLSNNSTHQFLFIRAEYKLMKISFDDILYIEGLKDYSKIYTKLTSNKAIITLQNLKSFEEKLSSEDFIRVHRSYIVSLSKIDIIHKNSILIGKTEIPVSDGFRNHLHSIIAKYL
ncbi:MAG: LytTR family DNA-binding domain-containing protein [Arachidicoccus sp.]|nr:LytTR family DNA-binding domain-containing protein [Arachidicoccus sp.]